MTSNDKKGARYNLNQAVFVLKHMSWLFRCLQWKEGRIRKSG